MPTIQQALTQLAVIIYFTIEYQRHVAGFIGKRLVSGLEVNDAQPPDTQGKVGEFEFAAAVRAAMLQPLRHLVDSVAVGRRFERQVEDSANAAHKKPDLMEEIQTVMAAIFLDLLLLLWRGNGRRRDFPNRVLPIRPQTNRRFFVWD